MLQLEPNYQLPTSQRSPAAGSVLLPRTGQVASWDGQKPTGKESSCFFGLGYVHGMHKSPRERKVAAFLGWVNVLSAPCMVLRLRVEEGGEVGSVVAVLVQLHCKVEVCP